MPPIFESEPPFTTRVFDTHFQITWDDAISVPEDNYTYKSVSSVSVIRAKKNYDGIGLVFILNLFTYGAGSLRARKYDEGLIKFKSGTVENRYIQGLTTASINEAIELISAKLKS
ncbi:MAG: hypothetical protein H0W84_03755 [Bacteroidetes bacterium]|nr:hypothetical protein [Bacteroidota bacterium]